MNIIDLVFPKNCLRCNAAGRYICAACLGRIARARLVCPVCEKPSIDGMTHFKCKKALSLDGLISLWNYEGVIRKAIVALKFKYATDLAKELAEICIGELERSSEFLVLGSESLLVPIPLYWYRKNYRGFNQTELMGKSIAKKTGWKYIPDLLIRKKSTTPQIELKGKERRKNLRGVFVFNPKYYTLCALRYTLVVFDDVFTTGSTMKEASKVLKRAGLKNIWGLTIAR